MTALAGMTVCAPAGAAPVLQQEALALMAARKTREAAKILLLLMTARARSLAMGSKEREGMMLPRGRAPGSSVFVTLLTVLRKANSRMLRHGCRLCILTMAGHTASG
jgi:hypothetical protein